MMKRTAIRALALLLVLCTLCTLAVAPVSAAETATDKALRQGVQYLLSTVPVQSDAWPVIVAARSTLTMPEGYSVPFVLALRQELADKDGKLSATRSTEYSRAILALSAIGMDPSDVDGYDLLLALGDYDFTVSAGVTAAAYALLALDCGGYDIPENKEAKTQATRQLYVDFLLGRQLEDGGWGLGKQSADTDVTAIVLQALARYRDNAAVDAAVLLGVQRLSSLQDSTGGFSTWGTATSESCSQVLLALCALGISVDDAQFVKNGQSVLSALLSYQLADGSFRHDTASDMTATIQALLALSAVKRASEAKPGVFDMSGVEQSVPAIALSKGLSASAVVKPDVSFSDVQTHKNRTAILTLARHGIINGMGSGTFCPDETMTRAQFAKIVVCGLGLTPEYRGTFSDVPQTQWYASYVDTAAAYGIVNGVGHGKFNPEGRITRQEAATMLARAAKLCALDTELPDEQIKTVLNAYPDGGSVASYARGTMAFCAQYGILPADETKLEPTREILRCEVAQMLYNLLRQTSLLDAA